MGSPKGTLALWGEGERLLTDEWGLALQFPIVFRSLSTRR